MSLHFTEFTHIFPFLSLPSELFILFPSDYLLVTTKYSLIYR